MSFKAAMGVSVSRAEILVRLEVQKRGLAPLLLPQNSVIIFDAEPMILEEKYVTKDKMEKVRKRQAYRISFTKPDLMFRLENSKYPLSVYLDGVVHRKRGVKNRDDQIDKQLTELGVPFKRFPYVNPTKKWVKMVVDWIEAKLNESRSPTIPDCK